MFSKLRGALALPILLFALSACSWIKNDPKSAKGFQSKNFDLSCIRQVPTGLQDLFGGKLTNSATDQEKVLDVFGCVDHALDTFANFTHGTNADYYTADELKSFANHYLPEGSGMSNDFVNSIFRIKRTIIGGTEENLTQDEIFMIRAKLSKFGQIIAPFAGNIGVLLSPRTSDPAARRAASLAFDKFVLSLSGILADSPHSLMWKDAINFVQELDQFSGKGNPTSLTLIREQMPILQYAKLMLVGGNEDVIETVKWDPIFKAISHFYGALLLTSKPSELLEQLSIEVQSTEEEQAKAVLRLDALFRRLIKDPKLHGYPTIRQLADRFSKALLLNAIVFPKHQGSLALKPFLESPELRKLAGQIIEEILKLDRDHLDVQTIRAICEKVVTFLEKSSIQVSTSGNEAVLLNLTKVVKYLDELAPLFESEEGYGSIRQTLGAIDHVTPILIDKSPDALSAKDLHLLIDQGLRYYTIFTQENKRPMTEKIGLIFDLLLKDPTTKSIDAKQIKSVIADVEKLFGYLQIEIPVSWKDLQSQAISAFKLKSLLFGTPETTMSREDLTRLSEYYAPFRKEKDLSKILALYADLLEQKPLPSLEITKLLPALDGMLPSNMRLSSNHVTPALVGHLKVLFIGGSGETLEQKEYPALVREFSRILKIFPNADAIGLNSRTVGFLTDTLKQFLKANDRSFKMTELKAVMQDIFDALDLHPSDRVLTDTLIGIHTRILMESHEPRPDALSGLRFSASNLDHLFALADRFKAGLSELERVYRSHRSDLLSRDILLESLENTSFQPLIRRIQPLLFGKDHHIHLPENGERADQYSLFDMGYRYVLYETVRFIFPLYKVTQDPSGPDARRLNVVDLTDLLSDLNDLITELGLSYGYAEPQVSAKSRMRSINLFTRAGNGDDYIDSIETTEFLIFTFGGKRILSAVEKTLYPKCFPGVPVAKIDEIPLQCLDTLFFQREALTRFYSAATPELINDMMTWDMNGMSEFRKAMLNSIQPDWESKGVVKRENLEPFISVPYYTENLFQRFDRNQDNYLQFSEAMKGFPIFCLEIKRSAGPKIKGSCRPGEDPGQVEAIYGYLLFKGKAPRGIRKGDNIFRKLVSAVDILLWFRKWRRLDKNPEVRDRKAPQIDRKGILEIMSTLATSSS